MATRRSKTGQFQKKTSRRRRASPANSPRRTNRKQPTSVLKLAESAIILNAVTTSVFGAGISDFFTGKRDGVYVAGGDGGQRLTLPEIIGLSGSGGVGGTYSASGRGVQSMTEAMRENLKANGMSLAVQLVAVPLAFKFGKKILAKPIINPVNKIIRNQLGVKEVKV